MRPLLSIVKESNPSGSEWLPAFRGRSPMARAGLANALARGPQDEMRRRLFPLADHLTAIRLGGTESPALARLRLIPQFAPRIQRSGRTRMFRHFITSGVRVLMPDS